LDSSEKKESTFEDQFARLKQASGAESDTALARSLGISQGSISAAKQKQQIPPGWVKIISSKYSVSADWLFFGEGPMHRDQPGKLVEFGSLRCLPGFDCVKRVKARLSSGSGSLLASDEIDSVYAFRSEWLRRKGNPETMVLMSVSGDSMMPVIHDEDTVLIDEGQREIFVGKMYAVAIDDMVYIKYIDREPGKYVLRSANLRYRSIDVDVLDESRNVRLIGRMVWLARETR